MEARPARAKAPEAKREPSQAVLEATVAFYAERGARGATERQVATHLEGLGLGGDASREAVDALVANGTIADAGFRRAAGRNATAAVYVVLPSRPTQSPTFG